MSANERAREWVNELESNGATCDDPKAVARAVFVATWATRVKQCHDQTVMPVERTKEYATTTLAQAQAVPAVQFSTIEQAEGWRERVDELHRVISTPDAEVAATYCHNSGVAQRFAVHAITLYDGMWMTRQRGILYAAAVERLYDTLLVPQQ